MGLCDQAKLQIKTTLASIYPMWESQELADQRRVHIPLETGGYTMRIQSHRGLTTSLAFRFLMWSDPVVATLKQVLEEHQPELLGQLLLPGQSWSLHDLAEHLACWCSYVSEALQQEQNTDEAIAKLIDELDR